MLSADRLREAVIEYVGTAKLVQREVSKYTTLTVCVCTVLMRLNVQIIYG